MTLSNKVKGLLKLTNKKGVEYYKALNLKSASALNMKYVRESFGVPDFIVLAELTGTQLAFIDKETGKPMVIFDIDDIKKPSE